MTERKRRKVPSWVVLGVLFGLLGVLSMWLFGPIGVSATYPRLFGALAPGWAEHTPYLRQVGHLARPETMIAAGLVLGGLLASRLGRQRACPAERVHASEKSGRRRLVHAFIGGFLLLFGARLAGGCTSGHVISGLMQLSLSGLVFAAGVFASGIVTARLLRKEGAK